MKFKEHFGDDEVNSLYHIQRTANIAEYTHWLTFLGRFVIFTIIIPKCSASKRNYHFKSNLLD